jgi:TonB family protein
MKTKLFFLLVLFLIPFGCKEEKKDPINYDDVWLAPAMLDENPKIASGNELTLVQRVRDYLKKKDELRNSDQKSEVEYFEYHIQISKNGTIDRLSIHKSNNSVVDSIVIDETIKWKFKAGIRKGKEVNSIYILNFTIDTKAESASVIESSFYVAVEIMPEPIGGLKAIQEKIVYPEIAKRAGIEGKVYVQAFIDEKGNVVSAKILKGIGAGCDEAALNAIKKTKFIPGGHNGRTVKTQVSIPIVFKLQ